MTLSLMSLAVWLMYISISNKWECQGLRAVETAQGVEGLVKAGGKDYKMCLLTAMQS